MLGCSSMYGRGRWGWVGLLTSLEFEDWQTALMLSLVSQIVEESSRSQQQQYSFGGKVPKLSRPYFYSRSSSSTVISSRVHVLTCQGTIDGDANDG